MKRRVLTGLMVIGLIVLFSSLVLAEEVQITVLHTNDTHSRVEEGKYDGMGFAKLATLIEKYRSENDHVLLLDAGDTFHGQTIANLVQGESIVKIYNSLGYDALVPGNHDFNFGQERLLELKELADFPIISANVKKGQETLLPPYIIKELGGVKVAIFGLSTPETTYKTHPKNVEGLDFVDPVETAKKMVAELKDKADVIIALSHLGLDESSVDTSRKVAEAVEGIDLIVDGHSHHALEEGVQVGDTLIVMSGEYDKNLGIVSLTIEDGKVIDKKAELFSKEQAADLTPNQEIIKLVDEIKVKNDEITSVIVGKTKVQLDGERSNVRSRETNLGNLITDAILAAVDADVAITNGGGIRASIAAGDVSKGDVITVLPFGNTVVVKEITGAALLDAVEHGLSAYPNAEGFFPQIGGMKVIFDPALPAGERVVKLLIRGKELDFDAKYRVATNDFMAAGGDGYEMFKDGKHVQEAGGLEEVLISYFQKEGNVAPKIEGRIIPVKKSGAYYKYEIKPGDVLSRIALIFNVQVEEIVTANNLADINTIYSGQELLIPVE